MLAPLDQQPQLETLAIEGLHVVLPPALKTFFCESGYLHTTADEARGNARLRVRSLGEFLLVNTPPTIRDALGNRVKRSGKVLLKDLSRSGIGLLFHEQLFPTEQFHIRFQGRLIHAVVVRCRRLGEKCYEVGGRILALETLPE